ncbi:MAG TPA: dienelactone hydrolase family protein [Bryobacteraceae bacterium]|nr:dienelactone hydrolase family protein [Bryobacteraceae bacterium]
MLGLLLLAFGIYDYNASAPFDIRVTKVEKRQGVEVRDITYDSSSGARKAAYLVVPANKGKHPAALMVHWYAPEEHDSNRTQYLGQAVELAQLGVISLLPETMWSEPKWFPTRKRSDDFEASARAVRDLRRELDLLLSQPDVDKTRVALVGHDFGAMYGSILITVDRRPTMYALQAFTNQMSHWYLYGPKMPEPERSEFIGKLKPMDATEHLSKAAPAPVLLQFGTKDHHVPKERAEASINATSSPKKVIWYETEHGLNDKAVRDRMEWLKQQLRL